MRLKFPPVPQQNFDSAFARVKELVADFRANENFYLSPAYQEQEARRDFIDKFWMALGWDVNHDTQKNPYEQEVKVERKEHGVSQRRADYAFYLAPNYRDVKFYVEAKKPHGDIATADNYFQTVRYGWNSQTPIAVLNDFEQFEIVDCRFKPNIETALSQDVRKFHFGDYEDTEKFAAIYWLFSREAVANGSIEKFAETLPKKRGKAVQFGLFKGGYQSIDEAFLEELDEHREHLARAFKNQNPDLDGECLTELTQRTLDRLVFLRFLEDKAIEPHHRIAHFGEKGTAWQDFIAESKRLNEIYNGIVYRKHDLLDSPKFKIADSDFSEICERFCHLNSPYDFNAIPIHILGSIYERFLGKVIVSTDKRARVEEKPEVRKAGGVYYTPEYIVRYIVKNTVGKLIEGRTPSQISEMRFADIACGSGSFLLGVYDYLLRYHSKYFNENPGKAKIAKRNRTDRADCVQREDGLHLTLEKKREILLKNIYGVDIDAQAVEVAQLSLYLKLLQDETPASARQYYLDFEQQALLPTLGKNIVCGNSLIGTDILSGQLFEPTEERKLNPMNFEDAFPEVMKHGGFDALVGNPPWGALFTEIELDYHRQHNQEIIVRMIDSFMYFVYQASKRLVKNGGLGMILPDVILYQSDNELLRRYLLKNSRLDYVLNLGDVFHKVTRPASVIICRLGESANRTVNVLDVSGIPKEEKAQVICDQSRFATLDQNELMEIPGAAFVTKAMTEYVIWNKLVETPHIKLTELMDEDGIQRGVSPDLKEAFIVDGKTVLEWKLENECLRKVLTGGKHVKRYYIGRPDLWLIYTTRDTNTKALPNIRAFIDQFASQITCKEVKQNKHSIYALHRARDERIFTKEKKFLGVITEDEIIIAPDDSRSFASDGLYLFGVKEDVAGNYVMGVLNSHLFVFIYRLLALESGRVLAQVKPTLLAQLPIRKIDFSKPTDKTRHDRIVQLVEQMLEAKKFLATAQTDKDKTYFENKCASLDRQIDALVYELYGLTAEEIKIVEDKSAKKNHERATA